MVMGNDPARLPPPPLWIQTRSPDQPGRCSTARLNREGGRQTAGRTRRQQPPAPAARTTMKGPRGRKDQLFSLIDAAEVGIPTIVRTLLDQGDPVSLTNGAGFTALHAAAHHSHVAVTRMLVEAGSELEAKTLEGDTPLHLATSTGQTDVMDALIEAGASVDSRNPGGATPLYVAAMEGHLGAAKTLLRAKANPLLTWSNSTGVTFVPLDVAVQTGRSAVVRELLRQLGIRGCGGPSAGLDALRQAAVYGKVDMIVMLMDAGVVDAAGLNLIEAIKSGQEAAVGCLLQQQKERHPGCQASYVNNARDGAGFTALLCSFSGSADGKLCNPRITRRLVDAGANTSSAVRVRFDIIRTFVTLTPQEYMSEMSATTDEHLHRLDAIRRLLVQAGAIHAVSWLWPGDAPFLARPTNSTNATKKLPSPLAAMLPVLRRRARRRCLLSETLFRWAVTRLGAESRSGVLASVFCVQ